MFINLRRPVALVAVMTVLVGCDQALGGACQKIDLLTQDAANLAALAKDHAGFSPTAEWLRHAMKCSIGPFVVYGPARGSSRHLIVTEKGRFIAVIAPDDALVFEAPDRLTASLSDRNHDGRFDWLDYRGRDPETGGDVAVVDSGLDGVADMRTIRNPDGTASRWFWVEGTWLQQVVRDGTTGFLVDGAFVTSREAAAARIRERHGR